MESNEKETDDTLDLPDIDDDFMPSERDIDSAREFARSVSPKTAALFDTKTFEGDD